jgi:Na+/proline symporter/signal transduction histidine kinase
MLAHWLILAVSFGYLGLLFAIAYYGDKRADAGRSIISNPYIYTLSIAVYCTAWTFYGSVGRAATTGVGFLPIYLGPTLIAALWWLLLRKIIRIAKTYRLTSIADFIASRYGKDPLVAGIVTVIALVGILPYISLQLKAVSTSFNVLYTFHSPAQPHLSSLWSDTALYVALVMAAFALLFGTRHIDASERHEGMVAAVAFESVVKLAAFLIAGVCISYYLFTGPSAPVLDAINSPRLARLMEMEAQPGGYVSWFTMIFLAMSAIIFLPRQFHILVVENVNEEHVRKASWLFPLYLLGINLFVLPIALAGLVLLPTGVDPDTYLLAVPLHAGQEGVALFVFLGGLSAATGMVIVETIALSTMICNDLVMPVLLRLRFLRQGNLGRVLLMVRRASIVAILLLSYAYFRLIGESYALVTIGLVSFAAAAQFAPPILIGIYWRRASRKGAIAGLLAGFALWFYTLLIPSFAISGWIPAAILEQGPWGLTLLRPQQLLGLGMFDPLTHSVFWSMLANVGLLVGVSLFDQQNAMERLQGTLFVDVFRHGESDDTRLWSGTATVADLKGLLARFLGPGKAEKAFAAYGAVHGLDLRTKVQADARLVGFAERELAGAIGAASARVMIASVAKGEEISLEEIMRIIDETSQVIEYSHRLEEKSLELEKTTAELRGANRRLKELDRLKDEFIATVTHELRTPLTSIRSFSEILRDHPRLPVEERQHFLEITVKESERLTRLINQVLDLAKIESDNVEWTDSIVDFNEVIDEAVSSLGQIFREWNIELEWGGTPEDIVVMGDRDRLIQVVINLLSNAVKFCEPGSGRVCVRLEVRSNRARVEVIDNGPGIPVDEQEMIFEKFHQLKGRRDEKPRGSGLGLTISQRIIAHHHGRIWVESAPGAGARFIFEVPLAKSAG